jgi:REP element-mobilizing transposase RayT
MSRRWKFVDDNGLYFVSYAVVDWVDVFVRNDYKQILVDSWKYCQEQKGLDIYAWCIMTSHVHLIIGSGTNLLPNIIRDTKRHSSEQLRKAITNHTQESRKEWMIPLFLNSGKKNSNNISWQLWQQNNKPILLQNEEMALRALNYIHNNPVVAGFVEEPQHWLYSSALDYNGRKGLLDIKVLM